MINTKTTPALEALASFMQLVDKTQTDYVRNALNHFIDKHEIYLTALASYDSYLQDKQGLSLAQLTELYNLDD